MFLYGSAFVLIVLLSGAAGHGQIRGRVVDPTGAPLGNAFIRLRSEEGGPIVYRSQSDRNGRFALEGIAVGVYSVRIWIRGFREKALHHIVAEPAGATDLGRLLLEFAGCDAPGVVCDCFASEAGCSDSVVRRGFLSLPRRCGADLDRGKSICGEENKSIRQTDIFFGTGEDKGLYLRPLNRALIGALNSAKADCIDATPVNGPIRIDGLGPGNDFWVRTTGGDCSHIFTTDDIEPEAIGVTLWYVNRRY